MLNLVRPEIELIVTAGDIPESITVDLEGLNIGDTVTISDVTLPEGAAPPLTLGAVNGPAFLLTIAMTLLTAPLGVRLAHRLDAGPLKRVFGVFLGLVALNMLRGVVWG